METYDAGTSITLTATAQGGAFQSWSGACSGSQSTCTVALDGPKVVTATFAGQTSSEYLLTVQKQGDGFGTVSSKPYGITLGQIAPYDSAKFQAESSVALTASATSGSRFDGWSGACSGTQPTCTVKMDATQTATATFSKSGSPTPTATPAPSASVKPTATPSTTPTPTASATARPAAPTALPEFELTITKAGQGSGAIYVWPQGRSQELCGSSDKECKMQYPVGTTVTFQILPRPDAQFESWSGACQGTSCTLTLDGDKKLTAIFEPAAIQKASHETEVITPPIPSIGPTPVPTPPYIPRVTPNPSAQANLPLIVQVSGKGVVQTPDKKINCGPQGPTCQAQYARYNQVPLAAYPAEGYRFVGWGGECRHAEGPGCVISMEGSSFATVTTYVRAVFEPGLQTLSVSVNGPGSVSSSEFRISCPPHCVGQFKTDDEVYLTAKPQAEATFERWEGACTGSFEKCRVTMEQARAVQAVFKGPPAPKKLSIVFPKELGGSFKVSTISRNGLTAVKTCDSNCTLEFKPHTQIEIMSNINAGFVWEGFSGSCLGGTANCVLVMDADKTTSVGFHKATFRKLTVEKPLQGTVINKYWYEGNIRCGPGNDACTKDFDSRSRPVLVFDGDYGAFSSGCSAVSKQVDQYGRPHQECYVQMNEDRTIRTELSSEQIKGIIGRALREAFDVPDYPGLKEFAIREDGPPFQYLLSQYRLGLTGKTQPDVKSWIQKNWDSLLQISGAGQYMKDYDLRFARSALYIAFNRDIENHKSKPWFKYKDAQDYIYVETSPPVQHALREFRNMHKKPVSDFEKHVLNNKQSYYVQDGIEAFFNEPPKATPTLRPRKDPVLHRIIPDNDQLGKPVSVELYAAEPVRKILIDGTELPISPLGNGNVRLPTVRYGIWPDFGAGSTLTIVTDVGRYDRKITQSLMSSATRNADGKEEHCFGAIGKGCFGLDGKDKGDEATNTFNRGGCLAVEDKYYRKCYVSAGSIRHDNCCAWNPGGKWCGGAGTDGKPAEENNHNGKCADEWNDAFWDSFFGRNWIERFNISGVDLLTPYPSPHKRYFSYEGATSASLCSPKGNKMREDKDAKFCCSGKVDFWKDCT